MAKKIGRPRGSYKKLREAEETDGETLSQYEVAKRLGISRSLVALIEREALAKLRRALLRASKA